MKKLLFVLMWLFTGNCFAQTAGIDNFLIKENLLKNSKLAIIAADSVGNPMETINGTYTFSASGFTQELTFNDGIAVLPLPIAKSTFVYIKHENDQGTHSKLVYVYKNDEGLNPFTISRMILIIIPLIIIVLIFAFKRFIYLGIILILVYFYFTSSQGLNVGTFFETTFDYLKSLV